MSISENITKRSPAILTVSGIAISWLTFWFFLISPVGFIIWLAILIFLLAKKSRPVWYLLLSAWISVPGCNFVRGTGNYFTGRAKLEGVGMPGRDFSNIDPETRLRQSTSGCIVIGFEPFVFIPNNLAVRLCTRTFGYQKGSYTGVFPSQKEALEWMEKTDTTLIIVQGNHLQIKTGNQVSLLDTVDFKEKARIYHPLQIDSVRAILIQNECLVFQTLRKQEYQHAETLYLVDVRRQEIIAQYFNHKE